MTGPTATDEATALRAILALCDARAGDDAAVLEVGGGQLCVSTDSTIAGVHAPPDTTPHALGRRAAARAISDLAAMGAAPHSMTCAVHAPAGGWQVAVDAMAGVAERGREQAMPLVGGDLCRTPGPLALVVTVLGRRAAARSDGFVARAGARAGDAVVVTGTLGVVAAAHARGEVPLPEPPDRLRAGQVLARHATALADLSDGVARDAANIAAASGVRVEVELDLLVVADGVEPAVAASFGDDYELLACIPPERLTAVRQALAEVDSQVGLTKVGVVTDGDPVARFTRAGREVQVPAGFVHQ